MLIEFSPRAKAAIHFAVDEVQTLKSEEVGAEHLPLGILSETQGKAFRILILLGADPNMIRSRLFEPTVAAAGSTGPGRTAPSAKLTNNYTCTLAIYTAFVNNTVSVAGCTVLPMLHYPRAAATIAIGGPVVR